MLRVSGYLPEGEWYKVSRVVGEEVGEESRFCGTSWTTVKTLDFIPSVIGNCWLAETRK